MDNPLIVPVAWQDKKFTTASGKVELYLGTAADESSAVGHYRPSAEAGGDLIDQEQYPLIMLTPHSGGRIHSQFHDLQDDGSMHMSVLMHPQTAIDYGAVDGGLVLLESPRGQAKGTVKLTEHVLAGVVVIESGWWIKYGGGVNFLTPDRVSDLGGTAVYYDCRCSVRRITEV